ncbi:MAG: ATP-binding protein, partial [Opitutae bacterium]|nr:ATP-binding protein [Opitutae bacterium]
EGHGNSLDGKGLEKLRGSLSKGTNDLLLALQRVDQNTFPNPSVLSILYHAVNDLKSLLGESNKSNRRLPVFVRESFSRDLLFVPGIRFGAPLVPVAMSNDEIVTKLIVASKADKPNYRNEFNSRLRDCSFIAANSILELIRDEEPKAVDLNALENEMDDRIKEVRSNTDKELKELRLILDRGMTLNIVKGDQLNILLSRLEDVDLEKIPDLDREFSAVDEYYGPLEIVSITDFITARDVITLIRSSLDRSFDSAKKIIRKKLTELLETFPERKEDADRVFSLIDEGELVVAWELIDLMDQNMALPKSDAQNPTFGEYFPEFVDELDELRKKGWFKQSKITKAVSSRGQLGPLNFKSMDGIRLMESQEFYTSWKKMKQDPNISNHVSGVLEGIGFNVEGIRTSKKFGSERATYEVDARPVADRKICPVAQFGSIANGHYSVSVFSGAFNLEEMMQTVVHGYHHVRPRIIFYAGYIGKLERIQLSKYCRNEGKQVLVLDDTLVCFLINRTGYRLSDFFSCTLPFTSAMPYVVKANTLLPVEIFVGRKNEIAEILNPLGSCLVYGGRQLGKTALLNHIVNRHHDPDNGLIVCTEELRDIGGTLPVEKFWERISSMLQKFHVTKNVTNDSESVCAEIIRWCDENPESRILLLLDEMDNFLAAEISKDFPNMRHIKALMSKTHNKVKLVFAGLHKVQGAGLSENPPLAHLGAPICIGPLEGPECREALDLITLPMGALGYTFANRDIPLNILTRVSYYPSLVQAFCSHLLKVISSQYENAKSPHPPTEITGNDIAKIVNSSQLRNDIRHRFRLTLELDDRYRLIALILALRTRGSHDHGASISELRSDEILMESLSWWKSGFSEDGSIDAFRILLEEMQGLGVISQDGSNYRLRSLNIASMLGSQEEIEAELLTFVDKLAPEKYDSQAYRRPLQENSHVLSPLTPRQEYNIFNGNKRITVAFGPEIHGTETLVKFFEEK